MSLAKFLLSFARFLQQNWGELLTLLRSFEPRGLQVSRYLWHPDQGEPQHHRDETKGAKPGHKSREHRLHSITLKFTVSSIWSLRASPEPAPAVADDASQSIS